MRNLLTPNDPPPFIRYNENGKAPLLFVCDHSGRAFPEQLGQLGLSDWVLDQHVTSDIGAGAVARHLADAFDATLIYNHYSRLVIDTNRYPDDPTICAEISGGISIPGNQSLGREERSARFREIYDPYHAEIAKRLEAFLADGIVPAIIAIHSCTPVFNDVVRPWHFGVLWDVDPRIAQPLIRHFDAMDGIHIGDNEPYSGRDPHDYTMDHHGEGNRIPHVSIEVRQDLIDSDAGASHWAQILYEGLAPILGREELYSRLSTADEYRAED